MNYDESIEFYESATKLFDLISNSSNPDVIFLVRGDTETGLLVAGDMENLALMLEANVKPGDMLFDAIIAFLQKHKFAMISDN